MLLGHLGYCQIQILIFLIQNLYMTILLDEKYQFFVEDNIYIPGTINLSY